MALFESYERRIDKINSVFSSFRKVDEELLEELEETQEMQKELYGTGNDEYEDEDGGIVHGQGNDEKRQDEYYRRKMYELETRLGNMILQTIVNGRKDVDSIEKDKKKKKTVYVRPVKEQPVKTKEMAEKEIEARHKERETSGEMSVEEVMALLREERDDNTIDWNKVAKEAVAHAEH